MKNCMLCLILWLVCRYFEKYAEKLDPVDTHGRKCKLLEFMTSIPYVLCSDRDAHPVYSYNHALANESKQSSSCMPSGPLKRKMVCRYAKTIPPLAILTALSL